MIFKRLSYLLFLLFLFYVSTCTSSVSIVFDNIVSEGNDISFNNENKIMFVEKEYTSSLLRGAVLVDDNDSTSFVSPHIITSVASTNIFSSASDTDYYSFTASYSRRYFIEINEISTNAQIWVYSDKGINLVNSYYAYTDKTNSDFATYTTYVKKNETIYIKTSSIGSGSAYSISVKEGDSLLPSSVVVADEYYDNSHSIQYGLSNAMYNTFIGNTNLTYADMFQQCLSEWSEVGNLSLTINNIYYDVAVSLDTLENIQLNYGETTLGTTLMNIITHNYFWITKTTFTATNIIFASDYSNNSDLNLYIYFIFMHEIGHSLGLDHYGSNSLTDLNYLKQNVMYYSVQYYDGLGCGDIASLKRIWG